MGSCTALSHTGNSECLFLSNSQRGGERLQSDMMLLLSETGLRTKVKAMDASAQTERWGWAEPVRSCLSAKSHRLLVSLAIPHSA
jgi:hypothetical protein